MLCSTATFPADYRANILELNILLGVKLEYTETHKSILSTIIRLCCANISPENPRINSDTLHIIHYP